MSDMEGISGIMRWSQVNGGEPLYEEGRRLYTEEINAAVRGAKAAGATEIVVMDCHGAGGDWSFNSLIPELLDADCEFVVQREWTEYRDFLKEGCDACLLIGMHAMAGAAGGVLSHTVSSQRWQNLWFNDRLVGEVGINASFCGSFGCPVALVTGDTQVCEESAELLGAGLTTVAVKCGLGRQSARNIAPARVRVLIEAAAHKALKNVKGVKPFNPGEPAEIKVEFMTTEAAVPFARKHGVESINPRLVVSRAKTWLEAWDQLYF